MSARGRKPRTAPTVRERAIIIQYGADSTFEEIGECWGFTLERARQIVERCIARGWCARRARLVTEAMVENARRLGPLAKALSAARLLEDNPDRNIEAEELLREGLTYSEVAAQLDISRCAVAGLAYRARRRAGYDHPEPLKADPVHAGAE